MDYRIKKAKIYSSIISIGIIGYSFFGIDTFIGSLVDYDNSSWMEKLDDEKNIVDIAIPGTHNSGALYSFADIAGKCQDVDIAGQLKMGIRYLDMRLQNNKNGFNVVHDFIDQKLKFTKVLDTCYTFLNNNPSEFILMAIKEDKEGNSEIDFNNRLVQLIDHSYFYTKNTLPNKIKDVRGKIVLLSRYAHSTIGINCYNSWLDEVDEKSNSFLLENNLIYVQDYYKVKELSYKKEEIINCMHYKGDKLKLNFASGYYVDGFPPSSAFALAKDINIWLNEDVLNNTKFKGVLALDFATSTLSEKIFGVNF